MLLLLLLLLLLRLLVLVGCPRKRRALWAGLPSGRRRTEKVERGQAGRRCE